MFKRVLIANRGEIAIRIARAAASLGVESVAVFTKADSMSLHTKLAGSACEIGGDAVRGYLDIEAVIAAAKASGSDCVHPGYGFLSENTLFAERCKAEGLRFIGPSPESLKLFGDKVEARAFAEAEGIPVIPGAPKLASSDEAKAKAKAIGYPVMLKASAGGGGRGMRAVAKPDEMDDAFVRCQGEAEAAFGDRALFLEKIVPRPRHIEVQVLGDGQGNVVHLFERDCSVQLRNQKVVEVAPAPNLDGGLRQRILADAVKLARAATYENAGTVEFLVNPETGQHFFIECNPRIQVEHTITEQVMGFDLVEAQFRIAAGASLGSLGLADQKAVGTPRGFAVQARVVAQGTGTLSAYREPSGPGVRVDACGYVGLAPPPQFDPLLAKLICQSGSSGCFDSAVDRTRRALDEFHIVGVPTNGDQLRAILANPEFRAGNARTTLLAEAIEPAKAKTGALQFLDQQVASLGRSRGASAPPARKQDGQTTGSAAAKESTGAIKAGRPRVVGGGGSFLPGHLGSTFYTEQLASVPVVNLLLGSVVGIGAAKAVLGHFSVMVRDISQLFVAGPPVVSHAMGYDVTKEDLGGWHIHCRNGSVDNLAETEEEAMAQTRRFLSYLPSSVYEAPPVTKSADPADRREEELLTLVPRKRTATFDVRRAIRLLADKDSFFEIGPLWGTDQVTGFVRLAGYPMGVIASDSRHVNGGALTADGCDKLKRHLDVCDLFHLPVLNLIDNPGFAVGIEHEIAGTIRKGGEWMVAFAQVTVPIFTVLMRRSFGVAGNNYATPRSMASARVAWPSADVGGIPPEGGIEAAYKRQLAEAPDPAALRAEINARIESVRGPIGPLNRFEIEEMIDPRDTRRLACEWVADAWRLVSQPSRLVPRPLQFRP